MILACPLLNCFCDKPVSTKKNLSYYTADKTERCYRCISPFLTNFKAAARYSELSVKWGKDPHSKGHATSSHCSMSGVCGAPSQDTWLPQSRCMGVWVQPLFQVLASSHRALLGTASPLSHHSSTLLLCSGLQKELSHHLGIKRRTTTQRPEQRCGMELCSWIIKWLLLRAWCRSEKRTGSCEKRQNTLAEQRFKTWACSPLTMVFAAIPTETGTNWSHDPLSASWFVPVAPFQPQEPHFQQADTNHTPVLTVYSMVPWGFWETIFFSFFSLVLFWLSSKEKKNIQVIDFQDVCLSICFERDLQGVQIASVNRNERTHEKVSIRP